jgi:hypothetical protein
MVYDFPDSTSVKTWLEGRTSHIELEVSSNGGGSWKSINDFDELSTIQPRGLRSTSLRLSGSLQRSAEDALQSSSSVPSPRSGETGAAQYRSGAARAAALKNDEKKNPNTKTEKKEQKPKTKRMRDQEADIDQSRRNFRLGTGVVILICSLIAWVFFQKNEARQTLPDTPAGEQLAWVIEALNGEANEMASAEIEQHFVTDSLSQAGQGDVGRGARLVLNELRFWEDQYAYYQFDQLVGRTTSSYLEAELATSVGETGVVGLEVEPDAPHRVISLWIRPLE